MTLYTGDKNMHMPENGIRRNSDACPAALLTLTNRQKEIAGFLSCTGLSYKQVASKLNISEGTMRKHAENVYRKLNVHSRAELTVVLLAENGDRPNTHIYKRVR
jgi:DNA-binding NarL/FixJ family response regulator